jgi:hypothetical protein
MSAAEAIRVARAAGVRVGIEGDDLILTAASAPPDAVLDALKRNKAEVVGLLRSGHDRVGTGLPFAEALAKLEARCPDHAPVDRWRQCIGDARRFLAQWGSQALALGWTAADLFGLHEPPEKPHPSYERLARHDATGVCWSLQGREVKVLTGSGAIIATPAGGTLTWRRKPL